MLHTQPLIKFGATFIFFFFFFAFKRAKVSYRAVLLEQRPGDELHQRQQLEQSFLLQAQQTQDFTELLAWHSAAL